MHKNLGLDGTLTQSTEDSMLNIFLCVPGILTVRVSSISLLAMQSNSEVKQ